MDFKLLVIDDEPIVRKGIRELIDLSQIGITEYKEASDGMEATKILESYKPDIILADINMPHMDGLSFAREAKKVLPLSRIILITGYDYFEYAREALRLGVDDYILKPVSRTEIQQILKNATNKLCQQRKEEEVQKAVSQFVSINDGTATDDNEYLPKIVKFMENNYQDQDFGLPVLALMMNLSQGYISRLFRIHFNKTFPEYLNELRLERARILIIGTNMKIYEVTEKCGYNDSNYFSMTFKKKYGCPPNKYRDMLKK